MAWSLNSYEQYIYSVQNLSPYIQASKLVLIRREEFLAEVTGSVLFASDIVLEAREFLYFLSPAFIYRYSYNVKKARKFYTGMTRKNIQPIRAFNPRIRITNTFLRTSNIIAFPRPEFHSANPISLS